MSDAPETGSALTAAAQSSGGDALEKELAVDWTTTRGGSAVRWTAAGGLSVVWKAADDSVPPSKTPTLMRG